MLGIFIVWSIASIVAGHLGTEKRVGYWETVVISFLLSPLVGAIVAATSRHKEDIETEKQILKTLNSILENQNKTL